MRVPARWFAPLFLLALAAPSLHWIASDHGVWPWDQAWYGEVSTDLWFLLTHDLAGWARTMATAMGDKPPALVWVGQFFVPLGMFFQSVEASLLLFILLTQLATLYLIGVVCRELYPESTMGPAVACLFCAGAPLFVGMSHQYFTEPLQALCVAWAYLIAVKARSWRRREVILQLIACAALGLLVKLSTPMYALIPFCIAAQALLFGPRSEYPPANRRRLLASGLAALVCVAGALVWYGINLGTVWKHAWESYAGPVSFAYGWRDTLLNKFFFWVGIAFRAFFDIRIPWLAIALACGGFAIALFRGELAASRPNGRMRGILTLGALAQLVLALLVFSGGIVVESRYLLPLLPGLALLIVKLTDVTQFKPLALAWVIVGGLQWCLTSWVAYGHAPPAWHEPWLSALESDPARSRELTQIIRATSLDGNGFRYHIIGVEFPWLNANSASFYAAKERLRTTRRCYYTSLGYAETDPRLAYKRFDDLNADFFVSVAASLQPTPPNFVNIVSAPVLLRVQADSTFQRVPFESKDGILLFRRVPH